MIEIILALSILTQTVDNKPTVTIPQNVDNQGVQSITADEVVTDSGFDREEVRSLFERFMIDNAGSMTLDPTILQVPVTGSPEGDLCWREPCPIQLNSDWQINFLGKQSSSTFAPRVEAVLDQNLLTQGENDYGILVQGPRDTKLELAQTDSDTAPPIILAVPKPVGDKQEWVVVVPEETMVAWSQGTEDKTPIESPGCYVPCEEGERLEKNGGQVHD